ncbi:MAG: cytochrome c biogenesis protein CcdA [Dehalococcoidia bacterium]
MTEVSYPIAFGAGIAAFFSPCILPLVPIYIANIGGVVSLSAETKRRAVFIHTVAFVIGFSIIYILMGASVGLFGMFIPNDILRIAGGVLLILFGIYLLAAMKIPRLNFEKSLSRPFWGKVGYMRSALMGAVFSVGIGTCAYGTLGLILTMAAVAQTAAKGALLLTVYSLGLGLPFIIVGLALDRAKPVLRWFSRHSVWTSIASSILLIVIGSLMLADIITYSI